MEKIPISGGPHSGKTTLLEALKTKFPHAYFVDEPATRVITREQEAHSMNLSYQPIVPWDKRDHVMKLWRQLAIEESVELEKAIPKDAGLVFLDRSLIDNIGYSRMDHQYGFFPEIDRRIHLAHYTFALFCEPVGDYEATFERRETVQEAKLTHNFLAQAYDESGLKVIHLPAVPVPERVEMVHAAVDQYSR